jgi:hypothetical protein
MVNKVHFGAGLDLVPATSMLMQEDYLNPAVRGQLGHIVRSYLKNKQTNKQKTHHKKRAGGVTQGVGPGFKSQYCKKKK